MGKYRAAKATMSFLGAVRTVTGSSTLINYNGTKILIDCGMFQGPRELRKLNWTIYNKEFAQSIDSIILTHAHVDHSALIPKLYQLGFRGNVYCTTGTYQLAQVLLPDTAYLQEEDARRLNSRNGSDQKKSLYSVKEAIESLKLFRPMERKEWFEIAKGLSFQFLRAGHILGSSLVQVSLSHGNGVRLLTFSGDLGNGRQKVIKGPEDIFETDDLILESTYGDRIQEKVSPENELCKHILEISKGTGALLIPAFAVGRTQEILFMIKKLEDDGRVPKLEVYLDSPMALEATDLYMNGGDELKEVFKKGKISQPLLPPNFHKVRKMEDSIRLVHKTGPIIIISAAGMLTGGRILYHLKHRLPGAENIVLFVGYQAEETKGRLLQNGMKNIRIHKENIPVKAKIKTVESLSAHADSDELVEWVSRIEKKPKQVYLNHGDLCAMKALAYRLNHELGLKVVIPDVNQEFELF